MFKYIVEYKSHTNTNIKKYMPIKIEGKWQVELY